MYPNKQNNVGIAMPQTTLILDGEHTTHKNDDYGDGLLLLYQHYRS